MKKRYVIYELSKNGDGYYELDNCTNLVFENESDALNHLEWYTSDDRYKDIPYTILPVYFTSS